MSGFKPVKALMSGLMLLTILAGCATQDGLIEQPDWAKKPVVWEYAGLKLASFGTPAFRQDNVQDDARLAEEAAQEKLRKLFAQEVAKAYLKAVPAGGLTEEQAASMLEDKIFSLLERQHWYDEQRRVYFVEIFIPASRIEELVFQTFNTRVKVQTDGSLKAV